MFKVSKLDAVTAFILCFIILGFAESSLAFVFIGNGLENENSYATRSNTNAKILDEKISKPISFRAAAMEQILNFNSDLFMRSLRWLSLIRFCLTVAFGSKVVDRFLRLTFFSLNFCSRTFVLDVLILQ